MKLNLVVCLILFVSILIVCYYFNWSYNFWFYAWFLVYSVQFLIIFFIAIFGVSPIYDRFYVRTELFLIVKIIFACLLCDFVIANFQFLIENILQIDTNHGNSNSIVFFYNKQLLQCIPETFSMLLIVYVCTLHVIKLAIKSQENDQFIEAVLRSQYNKRMKIKTKLRLKKKKLTKKAKKAWKKVSLKMSDTNMNYRQYDASNTNKRIGGASNSPNNIESSSDESSDNNGISGINADGGINALGNLDMESGIAMIDLPKLLQNYDGFIAFARHLVTFVSLFFFMPFCANFCVIFLFSTLTTFECLFVWIVCVLLVFFK